MPKNFDPEDPNNVIRALDRSFEKLCSSLEDLGVTRPKDLTTFEFYSRVTFYEDKIKNSNKPKTRRR